MSLVPYRRGSGTVDAGADFARNVSAIDKNVTTAQKDIRSTRTSLTSLQAVVADVQADVTTLQTDITTLIGDLSDLDDRVTTAEITITSLQASVSLLNMRATALEAIDILQGELIVGATLGLTGGTQTVPHSLGHAYKGAIAVGTSYPTLVIVYSAAAAIAASVDPTTDVYLTPVETAGVGSMTVDLWVF